MDPQRLRWMVRGLALAIVVICGSGLVTRLLPDVWPLVESSISPRLSYPVTYWNAFGVLAAIGITLCFGMTANERESRVVRVMAAAALPILGSALLLTLSRGGVGTAVIGVVVFAVVAHPRALLSGVLAAGPATAIAIAATYRAELLVAADPATSAAQAQGHDVALVVVLCAVAAAVLRALLLVADERLARLRPSPTGRRRLLAAGAVALGVAVAAAAVAVDVPRQYDAFVSSGASEAAAAGTAPANDPRARLTQISDSGRIDHWAVAIDDFHEHKLHGAGAGTFETAWDARRPSGTEVVDAHSLYVEVLGELGIIGLALLLMAIVTIMAGVARRARGPDRALFATLVAALVAWAVAAGFDWHWEMPVVSLWVFAVGGAAIAAKRRGRPPARVLGTVPRVAIATACVALILLVPVRLMVSQDRLESTAIAYVEGRCDRVFSDARASLDAVGSRPQPREFIAACEMLRRRTAPAIALLSAAVEDDPDNWRLYFSLAVARAHAGRDPRREIERARRLNPRDMEVQRAHEGLRRVRGPGAWRKAARDLGLQVTIPPV
jgi:O-antigen ligase